MVVGKNLTTKDTKEHEGRTHISQMRGDIGHQGPRRGSELGEIGLIADGAMLISGGKIVAVGTTKELMRDAWLKKNRARVQELDCTGRVVTPGFVDSHTHPVFARPRLVDFEKRVVGATYEEIAEAGGGIRASIKGVREASLKELTELTLEAFEEMARLGTTTVEAKSGYGLDYESELKSLEAIAAAGKRWAGTAVATLLAAHTVPPEFKKNPQDYVRMICQGGGPGVGEVRGCVLREGRIHVG